MSILYDIWRFSNIAYEYPKGKETIFSSCINFIPLNMDLDFGYIAQYSNRIIFAWRGTKDFFTHSGYQAWCENFNTYPLKENHSIHEGFYNAWEPFKREIDSFVQIMKRKKSFRFPPMYFTGHSRGSTIATIAARHMAKNLGIANSCIVYGTPAVGNKKFRNEFNTLPVNCTRVINGYDIFEHTPPHFLGFRHVGNRYWLKQPFWHKWLLKIYDHTPENYDKKIKSLLR